MQIYIYIHLKEGCQLPSHWCPMPSCYLPCPGAGMTDAHGRRGHIPSAPGMVNSLSLLAYCMPCTAVQGNASNYMCVDVCRSAMYVVIH